MKVEPGRTKEDNIMKHFVIDVVFGVAAFIYGQRATSQTNDCPVEINGSRRGEQWA